MDQLLALEAQVKELEIELDCTWDSITDLKLRVEDRETKLMERVKYIAHLEESLALSTSTLLRQEG